MDTVSLLMGGFSEAFSPMNLLWVFLGALLGTAVGVLPGMGSSMAVALLLPITFSLDPTAAFIMFAGVYFGGLFGDSTMAILVNTPGGSTAIATSFEGHKMALSGRAPQALATSAIGAFIGGLVATVLVVFFAPKLAEFAILFGPAEYFALAVFAFLACSAVVSDSLIKGLVSLIFGLLVATVGIDGISGTQRFTSSIPELFDGISIITITVGILALGEVFYKIYERKRPIPTQHRKITGTARLSFSDFKEALPAWLRGTSFGVPFGVIPVGGAEVPTFMPYTTERSLDARRKKPQFGHGAIRGVAAPEAAGNATAGTAMGALLAMGLPTSATAAIMLAAFQQYGIQPGPLLFERNADLVWPLLASLFIGLFVLLILNLPLAPMWAKLLLIPRHYLYAGIAVFCVLGVYATSPSVTDLLLVLGIGFVGFLFRRYDFPLAPVMIGVILGPLAETSFRNALLSSGGEYSILWGSSITWVLYGMMFIVLIAAGYKHYSNLRSARR
ncbi:tripartite tricarboxylate transporter TctA family protein [Corynebacterium suranareeae]|uniref:Tripartite tricarboxylate transporter TctA family protein n=1 Tax=Corynebacterium suranareeae TaxID=2506452 RepID=A0A169SCJ9_9CORY|nr:tripartite tricarboxylate transporter permease [Corynebacterium suranareeae]BAU97422.1 tripartite tricarboxylate transporter TctA family protein [Corynebacterium suranareeae]